MTRHTLVIRNRASHLQLPHPVFATLGNFDGVHVGHQALFARTVERRDSFEAREGRRGSAIAITFYPHPDIVLAKEPVSYLSTLRQKQRMCAHIGIDVLYLVHFTRQLAAMSAEDFIRRELREKLSIAHLVIGPDAHVGYKRRGTPEVILNEFVKAGCGAEIAPFVELDGERVSSGRIRRHIERGEVAAARTLLGRPFALEGRVVRGDQRGRTIGFPTANIVPGLQSVPALGVYATFLSLGGTLHPAVTNVGKRPTFGGTHVVVETHVLSPMPESFYDALVEVLFLDRLRDEKKFSGRDELVAQITIDRERAAALCAVENVAHIRESSGF